MMRSMFAAVSGLRNHQTRMDVIGNNIANVNTVGFKKSRVTFKDAFSQVLKGASRPQAGVGGTNPVQVGMGMTLGSIDVIHTKGNAQSTGKMTDLAIDGDGFFILSSSTGSLFYTRAGAFDFDREGNLVSLDGYRVQGWYLNEDGERVKNGFDQTVDPSAPPTNLALLHQLAPPKATEKVLLAGNLDSGSAERLGQRFQEIEDQAPDDPDAARTSALEQASFSRSFTVYDQKGNDYDVVIMFRPLVESDAVTENQWEWMIPAADDSDDPQVSGTLTFDDGGLLSSIDIGQGSAGTWEADSVNGKQVELTFVATDGAQTRQTFDFSGISQYADPRNQSVLQIQQDGYTYGELEEIVVDDKGVVSGSYSNGTSRPLLQVAIATFTNPAGLTGLGSSLYSMSNNSGDAQIEAPGVGMAGAVKPSSLEMSNVDLSEEFTDMIVTQRGFQANSRVITASDEMLQELVNIKR